MYKLKKRLLRPFCALLLSLCILSGSAYTSYAAAPVFFVSAPEAFAALLAMLGITAASDGAFSSADALTDWGQEQINDMVTYISTAQEYSETLGKLGVDALKTKITDWATKAGRGVVDTASDVWSALKSFVSNLYLGEQDSSVEMYGGRASSLNVGIEYSVVYHHSSSYSELRKFELFTSDNISSLAGFRLVESDGRCNFYYVATSAKSSISVSRYFGSGASSNGITTLNPVLSDGGMNYFMSGFYFSSVKDFTVTPEASFPLNYWPDSLGFNSVNIVNWLKNGVEVYPKSGYISVGGVGDIYERDKSLENVGLTGVGIGTKVGDVPIDWTGFGDLAATLEGVRAGTLDIAEVMAGSKVWAYDTTRDTVIDSDDDLENDIPIADVVPGASVADYTIAGLQDVFPFCIPFDLIDFLNVLDAEPEAPRFQWEFEYMKGKTYKFDIDLSRFEAVASAFRTFELLGFCLALILITRDKMIKG